MSRPGHARWSDTAVPKRPVAGNLMDGAAAVLHVLPADRAREEWWASWAVQRHAQDVCDLELLCAVTGLGGV